MKNANKKNSPKQSPNFYQIDIEWNIMKLSKKCMGSLSYFGVGCVRCLYIMVVAI